MSISYKVTILRLWIASTCYTANALFAREVLFSDMYIVHLVSSPGLSPELSSIAELVLTRTFSTHAMYGSSADHSPRVAVKCLGSRPVTRL